MYHEILTCNSSFKYLVERVSLSCLKSLHRYFFVIHKIPEYKVEISCESFTIHNLQLVLALHLENLSDKARFPEFQIYFLDAFMNGEFVSSLFFMTSYNLCIM